MGKKLKSTLNNPSLLNSLTKNDEAIQVIIETPKGSRNKYAFDEKQRVFALKKEQTQRYLAALKNPNIPDPGAPAGPNLSFSARTIGGMVQGVRFSR